MPFDRSVEGQRIRLVYTSDPYTELRCGDLGTAKFVDDAGTLAVAWDTGSNLGLIQGVDRWVVVDA